MDFTPYYLPLIWIEWNISILFIKSKKKKQTEKRCEGSSVNGICFNKIKFLKLLPSCKYVHSLQQSYLNCNIITFNDISVDCTVRFFILITYTLISFHMPVLFYRTDTTFNTGKHIFWILWKKGYMIYLQTAMLWTIDLT